MVDYFAIALSHGLLLLVGWRLLFRNDLDDDNAEPDPRLKPVQVRRLLPAPTAVTPLHRRDGREQG